MAPILSFTGEEVWTQLAGEDSSVFLHVWHELPAQAGEADLLERWARIRAVRAEVQKELETVRAPAASAPRCRPKSSCMPAPKPRPCWRRWATTCASC